MRLLTGAFSSGTDLRMIEAGPDEKIYPVGKLVTIVFALATEGGLPLLSTGSGVFLKFGRGVGAAMRRRSAFSPLEGSHF